MENGAPKTLTKKIARSQINQALSSLEDLKASLGKKKFKRRMQKVERILLKGLPKQKKIKQPGMQATA